MLRFTTRAGFPVDTETLLASGILFGGSVEPFSLAGAVQSTSPASSALRCGSCGGYWWPGCHWRGNTNWLCGLCGEENAIQGRMPNPDELREFVMVYRDKDDENPLGTRQQHPVYFYLVDLESEEAFLDAAMMAVASSIQVLPENSKFGLAICGRDYLTVFEFNETLEDYIAVTAKLRINDDTMGDGRFRVDLKDCTTIDLLTSPKGSFSLMRALNSIKTKRSAPTDSLKDSAAARYTCIGRSIESLAVKGYANEAAGAVKEGFGKVFSEKIEAEGKMQKEEGKHQVEAAKAMGHSEGIKDEAVGRAKEAQGDLTHDHAKQAEGKIQAAAGKVEQATNS
jgi:uncharacterized protein YjbJ (UPF0337 family)